MPGIPRACAGIRAIYRVEIEKLHLKECVDEEDVENILERDYDAVENSLQLRYAVDCLERPEHAEQFQRLELLSRGSSPEEIKRQNMYRAGL